MRRKAVAAATRTGEEARGSTDGATGSSLVVSAGAIVGSFRRLVENVVASAPSTGGTRVVLIEYFGSDDLAYDCVQFANDRGGGQSCCCRPGRLLVVEALAK